MLSASLCGGFNILFSFYLKKKQFFRAWREGTIKDIMIFHKDLYSKSLSGSQDMLLSTEGSGGMLSGGRFSISAPLSMGGSMVI